MFDRDNDREDRDDAYNGGGDDYEAMEDDNDVYDQDDRNDIVESDDEDGEDLMENMEQ